MSVRVRHSVKPYGAPRQKVRYIPDPTLKRHTLCLQEVARLGDLGLTMPPRPSFLRGSVLDELNRDCGRTSL